jgi:RNA-directed DNA polymerase
MKEMREWTWKALHKALRRRGYTGDYEDISMWRWRDSASPLLPMALPNRWFDETGLVNLEQYEIGISHEYYEIT